MIRLRHEDSFFQLNTVIMKVEWKLKTKLSVFFFWNKDENNINSSHMNSHCGAELEGKGKVVPVA